MTKRTARQAGAGAAAPVPAADTATATTAPVHTSAHRAGPPWPRDGYTGQGGRYQRDPVTGLRTPVLPADPSDGADTAAA